MFPKIRAWLEGLVIAARRLRKKRKGGATQFIAAVPPEATGVDVYRDKTMARKPIDLE